MRTRKSGEKNQNEALSRETRPLSLSFSLPFSCSDTNAILNETRTTQYTDWARKTTDANGEVLARGPTTPPSCSQTGSSFGRKEGGAPGAYSISLPRSHVLEFPRLYVFCRFAFQFSQQINVRFCEILLTKDMRSEKLYIIKIYNVTKAVINLQTNKCAFCKWKMDKCAYFSAALYVVFFSAYFGLATFTSEI